MSSLDESTLPCDWRKAKRSINNGECVEVASASGHVLVRDSVNGYPDTWPGLVSFLFKLGTQSWVKLLQVSILLTLLGGVVWLVASAH